LPASFHGSIPLAGIVIDVTAWKSSEEAFVDFQDVAKVTAGFMRCKAGWGRSVDCIADSVEQRVRLAKPADIGADEMFLPISYGTVHDSLSMGTCRRQGSLFPEN
jgi:hypothetical protein